MSEARGTSSFTYLKIVLSNAVSQKQKSYQDKVTQICSPGTDVEVIEAVDLHFSAGGSDKVKSKFTSVFTLYDCLVTAIQQNSDTKMVEVLFFANVVAFSKHKNVFSNVWIFNFVFQTKPTSFC